MGAGSGCARLQVLHALTPSKQASVPLRTSARHLPFFREGWDRMGLLLWEDGPGTGPKGAGGGRARCLDPLAEQKADWPRPLLRLHLRD